MPGSQFHKAEAIPPKNTALFLGHGEKTQCVPVVTQQFCHTTSNMSLPQLQTLVTKYPFIILARTILQILHDLLGFIACCHPRCLLNCGAENLDRKTIKRNEWTPVQLPN